VLLKSGLIGKKKRCVSKLAYWKMINSKGGVMETTYRRLKNRSGSKGHHTARGCEQANEPSDACICEARSLRLKAPLAHQLATGRIDVNNSADDRPSPCDVGIGVLSFLQMRGDRPRLKSQLEWVADE
jgi:hypothetical protein